MLRPRKTIDAATTCAKLDKFQSALKREVDKAEADPFDDAMVAAVNGLVEVIKAETAALAEAEARVGKVARKV